MYNKLVGITNLKVKIVNPAKPAKYKEVDFLVDSGAIYSVVDKKILEELGIKPTTEREFTLANGATIKRKMGGALFIYDKEEGYSPVVFGKRGDSSLLGAVTLEALGMILDPIRRRLLNIPMVLGGLTKLNPLVK